MDNIIKEINTKNKQVRRRKLFSFFLAIVLSLLGVISITSLLMRLNMVFGIKYFNCLVLTFIISSIYSYGVNSLIKKIDKKTKDIMLEINLLETEYKHERGIEFSDIQIIKKIELRFDGLSRENKIKLLNYIKDKIPSIDGLNKIFELENADIMSLINDIDSKNDSNKMQGRTRKRTITDGINNK